MNRAPLSEIEQSIVRKLAGARFPPGTASKRFAGGLIDGHIRELSDRGRTFLAFVVHRFRRQYVLDEAEQSWVTEWLHRRIEQDGAKQNQKTPLLRWAELDSNRGMASRDEKEKQGRLPGL